MDRTEPTILVVDDEPEVGRYVVATLTTHGFRALLATGGYGALAIYRARQDEIELVLTDIVMCDLNGPALACVLREMKPDVRVLFMSGYRADHFERYGAELGAAEVLAKPFTPGELIAAVRTALGRKASQRSA